MNDQDVIEQRLTEAFQAAHQSARWQADPWPDPAARVRRAARRVRARRGMFGVAGGVALAVAATFVAQAIPSHQDSVDVASPSPFGAVAAGSGLHWLLTPRQYATYEAAHPSPSPSPDIVASPVPPSAELRTLRHDVLAALGPQAAGATVLRADSADGGQAGQAVVWVRLADGTPLAVERRRLGYPLCVDGPAVVGAAQNALPPPARSAGSSGATPVHCQANRGEQASSPAVWSDGTAYTTLSGPLFGYSFGANQQWAGPIVWTVTRDGWFTMVTAPVSRSTLLGWAKAADAAFTAG